MKKTLFLATLVVCTLSVAAQNAIDYSLSTTSSKSFDMVAGLNTTIVAEESDQLLVSTRTSDPTNSYSDLITVRWVDKDLQVKKEYKMVDSRNYELLATVLTQNEVLFLVAIDKAAYFELRRVSLDKTTLKPIGEESVYKIASTQKGWTTYQFAQSDNGTYCAVVALRTYLDRSVECRLAMLDANLRYCWQRVDASMVNDHCMWVSDSGEVYTLQSQDRLILTKYNQEKKTQTNYVSKADASFARAAILKVTDGCMLVGGTLSRETPRHGKMTTGFFGLSFNMNTSEVMGEDYQSITPVEELVSDNKKLNASTRGFCSPLSIESMATTNYGGAFLLTQESSMSTTYGVTTGYRDGLLALGVNNEGKIIWRQPIRHCEISNSPFLFNQVMIADGNKVHVLHVENPKTPADEVVTDAQMKVFRPLTTKGNLVAITIDENGNVQKTRLAEERKETLTNTDKQWFGGHCYMLYIGKNNSSLLIINKQ